MRRRRPARRRARLFGVAARAGAAAGAASFGGATAGAAATGSAAWGVPLGGGRLHEMKGGGGVCVFLPSGFSFTRNGGGEGPASAEPRGQLPFFFAFLGCQPRADGHPPPPSAPPQVSSAGTPLSEPLPLLEVEEGPRAGGGAGGGPGGGPGGGRGGLIKNGEERTREWWFLFSSALGARARRVVGLRKGCVYLCTYFFNARACVEDGLQARARGVERASERSCFLPHPPRSPSTLLRVPPQRRLPVPFVEAKCRQDHIERGAAL